MPIAIPPQNPESFPEIENHILEERVFFFDEELETPATPYNSPTSPRNNGTDSPPTIPCAGVDSPL